MSEESKCSPISAWWAGARLTHVLVPVVPDNSYGATLAADRPHARPCHRNLHSHADCDVLQPHCSPHSHSKASLLMGVLFLARLAYPAAQEDAQSTHSSCTHRVQHEQQRSACASAMRMGARMCSRGTTPVSSPLVLLCLRGCTIPFSAESRCGVRGEGRCGECAIDVLQTPHATFCTP